MSSWTRRPASARRFAAQARRPLPSSTSGTRSLGNPITRIAHETVATFFPADPPTFYTVPFSLHDPDPIRALLEGAGFGQISWTHLEVIGTSPSAADAAMGLIEGSPILGAIMQRRPESLGDIKRAVARNITGRAGRSPARSRLRRPRIHRAAGQQE